MEQVEAQSRRKPAAAGLKSRPVRGPGLQHRSVPEESLWAACPHAASRTFLTQQPRYRSAFFPVESAMIREPPYAGCHFPECCQAFGAWDLIVLWSLGFGALNDAHRFSRSGNSAEHRQRRAALRGDENGVAPDR